jgi:hypothetical protein
MPRKYSPRKSSKLRTRGGPNDDLFEDARDVYSDDDEFFDMREEFENPTADYEKARSRHKKRVDSSYEQQEAGMEEEEEEEEEEEKTPKSGKIPFANLGSDFITHATIESFMKNQDLIVQYAEDIAFDLGVTKEKFKNMIDYLVNRMGKPRV